MVTNAQTAPSTSAGNGPLDRAKMKAYLIGGGIASLASAAYLIRDGGFSGENILILEETGAIGGSLDGQGSPENSYVI